MIAQEQLSNDKNELKAIVYQLIGVVEEQKLLIANQNQRIEEQSQEIKTLCQKNEEQAQKIDQLTYEVNVLKRHRFGKRSEKLEEDSTTPDNRNENTDTLTSPDAHVSVSSVFNFFPAHPVFEYRKPMAMQNIMIPNFFIF